MSSSGFYFNGRLYRTPTVVSRVDASGLANRNLSVGNILAILATSGGGGEPKTAVRFGSPAEAAATGVNGYALKAIEMAFAPSTQTGGPAEIVFMRVNPATQSTGTVKNGSAATIINLASADYGLTTAQIKYKIESGTTAGSKLTTQKGNDYYTQDDVARNVFSVEYTGAEASARMSITGTTLTLEAPNATSVASIDLNIYDTAQKVVDRINVVTGFTAAVLDGYVDHATLNALDIISNQDVKTAAYNVTANIQAAIDWFNGLTEGFVVATRVDGVAGAALANTDWTYLTGGSDGTTTNTDWTDAFTALQSVDVQWVVPISGSASIHAMADAHCQFMSTIGRMERRARCGTVSATDNTAALAAALALNSDRTSLQFQGVYDYDANGNLTLYPPYVAAALVGGMSTGVNPGTSLTNKSITVRGLERKLRIPVDSDVLIDGGLLCFDSNEFGYSILKDNSTWLVSDNYYRVLMATGVAGDHVARELRNALRTIVGESASPLALTDAKMRCVTTLNNLARPIPFGPGLLIGDQDNPPWKNLTISVEGNVMTIDVQVNLTVEIDYVGINIYAQAYNGTIVA
jgi:hypothetical protein